MPILTNARHERFAQEIAKGITITEAYVNAGYKPDDGNASKLASRPQIQDRIQEITGKAAVRAEMTVARVTEMFLEDRSLAREVKQVGAAVAATQHIGKLYGMFVEKVETKTEIKFVARIPEKKADAVKWQIEHSPAHPTVN